VEVWYQIPVQSLVVPSEFESTRKDEITKPYTFQLRIYAEGENDSAWITGKKRVQLFRERQDDYLIDFFPVQLYSGTFHYNFIIETDNQNLVSAGEIEVLPDTILFSCSDIMLGKKHVGGERLSHKYAFIPSVIGEFMNQDWLSSHVEIYGFVPDSLYYDVQYRIIDKTSNVVFQKHKQRLKFDYHQIETFTTTLNDFDVGDYTFSVDIFDPAVNETLSCRKSFSIIAPSLPTAAMHYYTEIQYIVKPSEYTKFQNLDEAAQKTYLSEFWSTRDYWAFETRLREADAQFTTGALKGRDSERGKYYIKNGPPDEIEIVPMAGVARPFEVWHYYSKGYDVVFSDVRDDGNLRLIKTLKLGELSTMMQRGFRDDEGKVEDWFLEIAPGASPLAEPKENINPEE
jgi:GWxTD domain-containing protein